MDPATVNLWHRVLWETVLAKHYPHSAMLSSGMNSARNPILEYLLPSLLYVKTIAAVDEVLSTYIDNGGTVMPRTYRQDLNGRICFLADSGSLSDSAVFHRLRQRRNELAHESSQHATWSELEADQRSVHSELQHIGIVGNFPQYEYFGERSAFRDVDDPRIFGERDIIFGVKLNDHVVVELKRTEQVHRIGQ